LNHGCRFASPTPIMARGIRSAASIVIVMMSIVFLSFVVVVLYACIITRSCRFVNPYRGQFRNFLGLVQPTIDRFVDDNQNGDDEKSMHCLFPCCCCCLLCSHYIYIIDINQPLSPPFLKFCQSSYKSLLFHDLRRPGGGSEVVSRCRVSI